MLSKHAHKTNLSWALPDLENVNHFSVNQTTLISLESGLLEHWCLFHSSIDLNSRYSHHPNMCTGPPWLPPEKFININPAEREIFFCSYLDIL